MAPRNNFGNIQLRVMPERPNAVRFNTDTNANMFTPLTALQKAQLNDEFITDGAGKSYEIKHNEVPFAGEVVDSYQPDL